MNSYKRTYEKTKIQKLDLKWFFATWTSVTTKEIFVAVWKMLAWKAFTYATARTTAEPMVLCQAKNAIIRPHDQSHHRKCCANYNATSGHLKLRLHPNWGCHDQTYLCRNTVSSFNQFKIKSWKPDGAAPNAEFLFGLRQKWKHREQLYVMRK